MQPAEKDPFDYKLRSKEQVKEEMRYFPPDFEIEFHYKNYTAGDTRLEDNLDNRDRVAKIYFDLRDLRLAPL